MSAILNDHTIRKEVGEAINIYNERDTNYFPLFIQVTSSQKKRKSKGLKSEPKIKRSRIMQLSDSDSGKDCYSSNS